MNEQDGWLERRLGNWGETVAANRRRVLFCALLVTLVALPFAYVAVTNLDVNLFNQASDRLSRFRLMREISNDFGGDLVAAVLTVPDKPTPQQVDELKRFADLLAKELQTVGTRPEDVAALPEKLREEVRRASGKQNEPFNTATETPDWVPNSVPWLRNVESRTGQGLEQALKKIARDRPYVTLTPADVVELKKRSNPRR